MTPPPVEAAAPPAADSWGASLPEVFRSVPVPKDASTWRKMGAFAGPGYLVAVGYMDPGNWATDLAGGSAFGYTLLTVILMSNLMAVVLQALCARLGIVGEMDLAQACRRHYSRPVNLSLWIACELAIIACDLAEVIGTAIALQLLFGLPLLWGILLTGLDVFVVLALQRLGFRWLEAFIISLLVIIAGCFAVELAWSQPVWGDVALGFLPSAEVVTNPTMLYIAIGILGATVMPHNLYLHSAIVQTRQYERTDAGRRQAVKYATWDSTIALSLALFVNAAILILAASAFHTTGQTEVAEIQDAYQLLAPTLGVGLASTLFAVALLASGQNSTVTATLAGQIVMEGFLDLRLPAWARRVITRGLAIIPAAGVAAIAGEGATGELLVLSQVVLSMQLPFAIVPLIRFTGDAAIMGRWANPVWMKALVWGIAGVIIALNVKLLWDTAALL